MNKLEEMEMEEVKATPIYDDEPTFTLVTDESFDICDYIPAPFNTKDNDFSAQADALFSDFCVINNDNTAVGFIGDDAVICKQAHTSNNTLHLHLVNEIGAGYLGQEHFPFCEAMRNFFGNDWNAIREGWIISGKLHFVVHDNCNEMYIHVAVHENAAISMIFTADIKEEGIQ